MEEAKVLLKIIKSFLEDTKCPETKEIEEEKLYQLAKKHKVENFLKTWAETSCQSEEIRKLVLASYHTQIIKDTNENIELEQILDQLEESQIETLVVKGVIMKEVYPKDYMRQMCDMDILVHRKDFKEASKKLEELGFRKYYDNEVHQVFVKKPFINVELHRILFLGEDVWAKYFNHIWSSSITYKNYNYVYRMDIEDTYLFCIIHLMHHFKVSGVKIRDILDVYLINEKYKTIFDYNKLSQKLQELNAKEFEKNIKNIAYKWFETNQINELDEIEQFILQGEDIKIRINYRVIENQGKWDYVLKILFPKFKVMKQRYPILKTLPILLPIMWIIRIFHKAFSKENTMKERIRKITLIQKTKQEDVRRIEEIYKKVGIIEEKNT